MAQESKEKAKKTFQENLAQMVAKKKQDIVSKEIIGGLQVQFKELRGLYGNNETKTKKVSEMMFKSDLKNELKR